MVIELLPLQLAFRGLSDEDPDEISIDSPDADDDGDDDGDGLLGGGDGDADGDDDGATVE